MKTLGSLTNDDLEAHCAWAVGGETEDGDKILEPVPLEDGAISEFIGEVWCRSHATFSNGLVMPACAMYRGDADEGPLAWTVWNGERDVPLIVPPAPAFVLEVDGPDVFARAFGLSVEQVFPVEISALCLFAKPPFKRSATIGSEGVLATAG